MSDLEMPPQPLTSASNPAQAQPMDQEFPITYARFVKEHLHKTGNHVYAKLLKASCGAQSFTVSGWHAQVDALRNMPAYRT